MKNKILKLKNVSSGYGEIKILKNISLDLNEGEILGILGRNGMGKSTLIKTISGLIKPYEGSIFFKEYAMVRPPIPESNIPIGLFCIDLKYN